MNAPKSITPRHAAEPSKKPPGIRTLPGDVKIVDAKTVKRKVEKPESKPE